MRFLPEKFKTSLNRCTALQLQSLGLGLICIIFFFAVRYTSVWHWDDTAYLRNIFQSLPSDLLLGRPGFMYPFITLWFFVKNLGGSFYFVEDAIRISGILFLTGAYVYLFRILVALNFPVRFSFITILFLLSEFSFSVISTRVGDSAMMYLCITASYFYFIKAHESGRYKYLLLSSLLFGYAFLTREPALFYFPFYIVLLIYFSRRNRLFNLKSYGISAALTALTCISVFMLLALVYGKQYFDNFHLSSSSGYLIARSSVAHRLGIIWNEQINQILLPLALAGLVIFLKRSGWRYFAGFAFCCMGPLVITYFFSVDDLLEEPRAFMALFFVVAFAVAYLIEAAVGFFSGKWPKYVALAAACVIVAYVSFIRFMPQYHSHLNKISHLKNYYEDIKPLLEKDVVVILGEETLYVVYRGTVEGVGPRFISPGWSWPSGKLVERLNEIFSDNRTVIYDPRGRAYLEEKRGKDLDEMTEKFELTETKNGFLRVSPKK